jgi:hypothetical protein
MLTRTARSQIAILSWSKASLSRWCGLDYSIGQCCIGRSVRVTERDSGGDRPFRWLSRAEGHAEPVACGDINGEFIVAAAQILRARARRPGSARTGDVSARGAGDAPLFPPLREVPAQAAPPES